MSDTHTPTHPHEEDTPAAARSGAGDAGTPADFRQAMQALADNPLFAKVAPMVYPGQTLQQARGRLLALPDRAAFLKQPMYQACSAIIRLTTSGFTYSGTENLPARGGCLFISNHRDIVLDAMLLQYLLIKEGREPIYEVVGTNLYEMPLVALLADSCQMIGVGRGGGSMDYGRSLLRLSSTIRSLVVGQGEGVWIAQRNGRTKDGLDATDPALLKMIAASGSRRNPAAALAEMNIVPVCISYEWEPCGPQKAREVCLRRLGPYQKAPGEDTESIVGGVTGFKGGVHIALCPPLSGADLSVCGGDFKAVAALLDSRIQAARRLFPNSCIAHALRCGGSPLAPEVQATDQQVEAFTRYLDEAESRCPGIPGFRSALLDIYANCVECPAAESVTPQKVTPTQ